MTDLLSYIHHTNQYLELLWALELPSTLEAHRCTLRLYVHSTLAYSSSRGRATSITLSGRLYNLQSISALPFPFDRGLRGGL